MNFNNDEVVRTLTEVLLHEDFGIETRVPDGYLVPRIPQRLNYVLVLEDLIKLNNIADETVIGLDIGKKFFVSLIYFRYGTNLHVC